MRETLNRAATTALTSNKGVDTVVRLTIVAAIVLACVTLLLGCQRTEIRARPITINVLALPSGSPINFDGPFLKVANALVEVAGTSIKGRTNADGQVVLTVPFGLQTFIITPPDQKLLKKATYRADVQEFGTDNLGFALSPDRELFIDNVK